jgi:hypothetical protein
MAGPPASSSRRVATLVIVLAILAIYSYPYLATSWTLGSRLVPYEFAADLSFYLNLGQLGSSHHQPGLNPYYGTAMQAGGFGYLTFDLAFRVFGWLENVLDHNLWCAVLVWSWLWWMAICIGAFWFFRLALPEEAAPVRNLGVSLLFFFNFGILKSLLGAWLHFPSVAGFEALSLPYIRTFFPPIPVALLLLYLSLQIRGLRFSRWYDWAAMCLLQAVAFAMFPYVTLLMAGSTFVVAIAFFASLSPRGWLRIIVPYGAASAVIDFLFLFLRRMGPVAHDPNVSVFRIRPSHIFDLTGGALILLLLLSTLTLVLPPFGSREAKWTLAGLGFSNILLMLADTVFAPSLLLSVHGGYFLHCTIALQTAYFAAALFARLKAMHAWVKPACLAAIFLVVVNGAMLALGNYRAFLPQNKEISEFARAVSSLKVVDGDLILARADSVDDLCAWAPLLTRGTVIFCRSAQYELSDSERRGFHRFRQALYLFFTGKDSRWVEGVLRDPAALTEQDRLAFAGEINPSDQETLNTGKREIEAELVPRLGEVEKLQSLTQFLARPYPRVLVIDDARHRVFVRERLSSFLTIDSEQQVGDFVLLWCRPNAG